MAGVPFAAALLAGGKSRRMGRDKALLDWQGVPLWKVQWQKLRALQPAQLMLSCRAEQGLAMDEALILHDAPGASGPLQALAACLAATDLPLLVLAVDMPRMDAAFLKKLAALPADHQGIIAHGGHGYEPLAAVYPQTVRPLLEAALAEGRHRLQDFVTAAVKQDLLRVLELSAAEEAFFFNCNTPADLA